jgi:hypothetical protein
VAHYCLLLPRPFPFYRHLPYKYLYPNYPLPIHHLSRPFTASDTFIPSHHPSTPSLARAIVFERGLLAALDSFSQGVLGGGSGGGSGRGGGGDEGSEGDLLCEAACS